MRMNTRLSFDRLTLRYAINGILSLRMDVVYLVSETATAPADVVFGADAVHATASKIPAILERAPRGAIAIDTTLEDTW